MVVLVVLIRVMMYAVMIIVLVMSLSEGMAGARRLRPGQGRNCGRCEVALAGLV